MNKASFLETLAARLSALPQSEIGKSIAYFSEIIDDRVEDGMTEEEAVASLEDIEQIVNKIMQETPMPVLMKEKFKSRRHMAPWAIVLIILGFPLWFPLFMAFFVVALSMYVVIWALVISVFALVLGLGFSGIIAFVATPFAFGLAGFASGLFFLGGSLICIGLGVLMFIAAVLFAKAVVRFTVWFWKKLKLLFIRKEGAVK